MSIELGELISYAVRGLELEIQEAGETLTYMKMQPEEEDMVKDTIRFELYIERLENQLEELNALDETINPWDDKEEEE